LLGPHPRPPAGPRPGGRADHAPGPREPRGGDLAGGRRWALLGDPRPGRQGRGGAHRRPAAPCRPQDRGGGVSARGTGAAVLIKNGPVVDPVNGVDGVQDVLIDGGTIKRIGPKLPAPERAEGVDAAGKVVCPGLIDIHVHLREPGQEYKETVATGTRAAAAGGF